jgi:predicted metal-binding membrane protein
MLALNPPSMLATGWLLMVAAMMPPLLLPVLTHVRDRSLPNRRGRAIAFLLTGYLGVWLIAGCAVLPLSLALSLTLAEPWTAVTAAIAALGWQVSPARQRCLNRCHRMPALRAFGWRAEADAIAFGTGQGLWCAAACSPLMLLCLLVPGWHVTAMALAAAWLSAERLERPDSPRWTLRWPAKAFRIARIRLASWHASAPGAPA